MTNFETVNEFMRRFCEKDLDGACELVTDDVEYDNVPIGTNIGPEGIRAVAASLLDGFDSIEFTVHRSAADGAVVMNERTDRFIVGDRSWDVPVAGVFELTDDGRIRLWRDFFDMGVVNEMLGALSA